jgi:hypothetical protein
MGKTKKGEKAAYDWKTKFPGVVSRHSAKCPIRDGRECTCGPRGYRASIRGAETNLRIVSPKFESLPEALEWQRDQLGSQDESQDGLPSEVDRSELGALIEEFIEAAEDGVARDPRGQPYTAEGLRALRGGLSYVDTELGAMTLEGVRQRHVQGLVTQLRGAGLAPARIFGVVDALNALYSYAIRRDLVGSSPVVELELLESEKGPYVDPQTPPPFALAGDPPAPPPFAAQRAPWTPPPFAAAESPQAPPPFAATGSPPTPPPFTATGAAWTPPPYGTPGYVSGGVPQPQLNGHGSGPFSAMFGAPATTAAPDANYDATMQERWLWWTVRIIVIVFVLIALVLVAESV